MRPKTLMLHQSQSSTSYIKLFYQHFNHKNEESTLIPIMLKKMMNIEHYNGLTERHACRYYVHNLMLLVLVRLNTEEHFMLS